MPPTKIILYGFVALALSYGAYETHRIKDRHCLLTQQAGTQLDEMTQSIALFNPGQLEHLIGLARNQPEGAAIGQTGLAIQKTQRQLTDSILSRADNRLSVLSNLLSLHLAWYDTIQQLHQALEERHRMEYNHFIPVIQLEKDCVAHGKPIPVKLYFCNYFPLRKDQHIQANGKEIRTEEGVGRFETVFTQPGQTEIQLSFSLRSPVDATKTLKNYHKRFSINVCQ